MGMFEGKVMLFEGATGEPLPTSQGLEQLAEQERQRAEQEHQRAEQEYQRAEQEHQRAQRLAERLHQLGINPDEV
jgi:bacterioferritin (cytochrome b1)